MAAVLYSAYKAKHYSNMKTKTIVSKVGDVKVVNAVSTIHKILDEISENGRINCQMLSTENDVSFVFIANGVCMTCHVQDMPIMKGGQA